MIAQNTKHKSKYVALTARILYDYGKIERQTRTCGIILQDAINTEFVPVLDLAN